MLFFFMVIVVFFLYSTNACDILHSTAQLRLYDNNMTGEFTCPAFIDECYISCIGDGGACRSVL